MKNIFKVALEPGIYLYGIFVLEFIHAISCVHGGTWTGMRVGQQSYWGVIERSYGLEKKLLVILVVLWWTGTCSLVVIHGTGGGRNVMGL